MSKFRRRFLWAILGLCCANVLACFIAAHEIGSDALKGKAVDGHFYVGHGGNLVEVSKSTYIYAGLQELSLFLTLPLAGIVGVMLKEAGSDARSKSK